MDAHETIRGALAPYLRTALAGFAALALAACDDVGPNSGATVEVLVTDAPSDYIDMAEIWVSRVYLQGGSDTSEDDADGDGIDDGEDPEVAGRVDLFDDADNPLYFDLLTLRDGVVEALTGDVAVEPGSYAQLRLVVDSARVTLVEGTTFQDGESVAVLKVPSGSTSGIKVQLTQPIEAGEGESVTIVVDFDVDANFVLQGNPESPGGLNGVMFTPTLRELSRDVEES